jgi:hypothetical protein
MNETKEEIPKPVIVSRVAYRDGTKRYKYAYFYTEKRYVEIIVWKLPNYKLIFN